MIDLCLKFANKAAADSALYTTQFYTDDNGTEIEAVMPKYQGVDMIGTIEGVEGWHVNVRHGVEMPELAAWVVSPLTPARVWF